MSIDLYWGSGSTPAWRVLLGLQAKGLAWNSHLLSFSQRETRTPAFLALNPRGKVPTLVDDGLVINESLAILAYLDRKYTQNPLFGTTPEETGNIWRMALEFESHGSPTWSAVTRPILFGTLAQDEAKVREGIPALHEELALLERRVASGYLVGASVSAADIVWYCGLQVLVRAATRPVAADLDLSVWPLAGRYPGLLPWAGHVEAITGFESTIPPHWLEGASPSPRRLV